MLRQTILVDITDRLFNDDSPEAVVLLAMGGAGKTQLALEVCDQAERSSRFGAVLWVDASSPKSVIQSYKSIAQKKIKVQSYDLDDEDTIRLVQDALRDWDEQWLIVFDNYDNPQAFQGNSIRKYLPGGRRGRTLFTSRHQDTARLGHKIDVSTMTENESLELLLQRPALNEYESTHGRKIVSTLGHLALAIDQARAYIRARSLDLKEFMQHYHDRKEIVLQEIPDEWEYSRVIDDEQRETQLRIFTTWGLSFKQIPGQEREVQDKEHFLTLAAFFDAGNVSERYFQAYFNKSNPDWMKILSSNGRWDSYKLGDVLSEFQKLSLLQTQSRTDEGHFISIHPVICDWIKLRRNSSVQHKFAIELGTALTHYLENTDVHLLSLEARMETLRHIDSCILTDRKLSQSSSQILDCHPISLSLFARFYSFHGRYNEAEGLYKRALAVNEERIGAMSPENAHIMQDLAWVLSRNGQYDEAERLYEQILVEREKRFGEVDTETLLAVENLGQNYVEQGRYNKAESSLNRALKGNEEILGSMHAHTLRTAENLAAVYTRQHRYDEAETLYKRALIGKEKEFGETHLRTLNTVGNLASVYADQDRSHEAETLYRRALSGFQEKLGATHPQTLNTMHNLANVYNRQGRHNEAEELFQRVLTGIRETLGARHPDTLGTMKGLAATYGMEGKYDKEEELLQRALSGNRETLGARHPHTLETMHYLALTYNSQKRYNEGKEMFQAALTGRIETLGARHLDTLRTMHCLALTYYYQGRYDKAKEMFQEALTGTVEVLGATHQHTLMTVKELAETYRRLGQHEEAEDLEKRYPSPQLQANSSRASRSAPLP